MRKQKEIKEYIDEAFDRVWFVRAMAQVEHEIDEEFKKPEELNPERTKQIARIAKQYGLETKLDEWGLDCDYQYWCGILAALRWVLGDDKDNLDT